MDSINFLGKADFPNTSQTMDMLQGIAKMGGTAAAKLGGENYIMSGCVDHAGVVSDGVIVIEGMPYNFEGGNKKDKLTIKEVKETLMAFGVEYPEARTKRSVVFSDNGPYNWGDFKQVLTNTELEKRIESIKGTPLGVVEMWVGYLDKIPSNYKLCNGDILSIEEYKELHAVIGTIHGSQGLTGFALPDMRSMFTVGHDNRHNDYNEVGKKGGKEKITLSEEELPKHTHVYSDDTNAMGSFTLDGKSFPTKVEGINNQESSAKSGGSGTLYQSSETGESKPFDIRPPFFAVAYIMKVKD